MLFSHYSPVGPKSVTNISNAMLSAIVEQTADAVLVTNGEGIIEYVNPSFENLTGFKREEVLGRTPAILKSGKHDNDFYTRLWKTIREGRPYKGVLINKKKNGELYYSHKTITPLKTNGVITHFVSTDKDITEAKKSEAELNRRAEDLAKSNQDLELFARFVAHDLQEPVRMVVSYLHLLKEKLGPRDQDCLDYLAFACEGGKRIQRMIRSILRYSKLGRETHFFPVNCEQVLAEALDNLAIPIREKHATIVHGKLPLLNGDKDQLMQLFQNLISNALKYHGKGTPEIHIDALKKGDEWVFSVKDNGIGISPENTRRIFCLFQRLHGATEYSGFGIGLALCERIVSRHGGRIWVESQPGLGSTFFFTLPAKNDLTASQIGFP